MSILSGFRAKKRFEDIGEGKKQLLSYWTSSDTVECTDKTTLSETLSLKADQAALDNKADKSLLLTHTNTSDIHVTAKKKAEWDAKQNALTIDTGLNSSSMNPVQNKVIYSELSKLKSNSTAYQNVFLNPNLNILNFTINNFNQYKYFIGTCVFDYPVNAYTTTLIFYTDGHTAVNVGYMSSFYINSTTWGTLRLLVKSITNGNVNFDINYFIGASMIPSKVGLYKLNGYYV